MSLKEYFQPSELAARAWVVAGLFLPVNKTIAVIAIFLVGLFTWIGPGISNHLQNLRRNYLLWFPALYFIWHLISLGWSENRDYAARDLETKLSFLLIPLMIGASAPGQRQRLNFFIALTVGVILNGLWSLFNAFQAFETDGLTSNFFYIELSKLTHVAYLTMMVTMCLLYLIYDLFYSRKMDPQPWALITAMLLLSLFTVMLDSRTAFFTMLLVCISYFLVTIVRLNKVKDNIYPFVLFLVLFSAGYYGLSRIHNRMGELTSAVQSINTEVLPEEEGKEADYGNAGVRPVLWKNAVTVIRNDPFFGTGCGDLKDELQKQYRSAGFFTGIKFNLNPHNQYLHTTVGVGLIGLVFLLMMLMIPAWKAFQQKNWFVFAFLLVFILNGVTESVLEVQNGVLLFTMVYALLIPELFVDKKEQVNFN
jgi:O-antigen ligase